MNPFQKQFQAKMERLRRIEQAVYAKDLQDPVAVTARAALSFDERVLAVIEQVVIHVGLLEEHHNRLAHAVRINKQTEITELGGK